MSIVPRESARICRFVREQREKKVNSGEEKKRRILIRRSVLYEKVTRVRHVTLDHVSIILICKKDRSLLSTNKSAGLIECRKSREKSNFLFVHNSIVKLSLKLIILFKS